MIDGMDDRLIDSAKLQDNINTLTQWEQDWQMKFNTAKCNIITITRKKTPHSATYLMHDIQLSRVSCATYLGLEINSKLTWDDHISKVTAKANRSLGMLRRNLSHAPTNIKALAYQAITRPTLEYGSAI
jgi:hypothetical protein